MKCSPFKTSVDDTLMSINDRHTDGVIGTVLFSVM